MKESVMLEKIILVIIFILFALTVVMLVIKPTPFTHLLARFDIFLDEEYECEEDDKKYYLSKKEVAVIDTTYLISMCMWNRNGHMNEYEILLTSTYCKVYDLVSAFECDESGFNLNYKPLVIRNDTFCLKNIDVVKSYYDAFTKANPFKMKCVQHKNTYYLDGVDINVETHLSSGEKNTFTIKLNKYFKKKYNKIQGVIILILLESGFLNMQQLEDLFGRSVSVSSTFELIVKE